MTSEMKAVFDMYTDKTFKFFYNNDITITQYLVIHIIM